MLNQSGTYLTFVKFRSGIYWPVAFIYVWMILNLLTLSADREILWGPDNVFFRFGQSDRLLENLVLRLYYQPGSYRWVYYAHFIACFFAISNRSWSFLPRIIAWGSGLLLYNAAWAAFGWSMPLMLNLALLSAFMHSKSKLAWRISLNTTLLWMMRIQCLIFFAVLALYQWGSTQWLSGDAVYYQWHLDYFLIEKMHSSRASLFTFIHILNYGWMSYCTLLPIAIWIKPMRRAIVRTGFVFAAIYFCFWSAQINAIALVALLLPWSKKRSELPKSTEFTGAPQ